MVRVYRFSWADKVCSAAAYADVVSAFGKEEAFWLYFGGGLIYGTPYSPDFLGVWGARNASRLRRMLSKLGRALEIVDTVPPAVLTSWSTTGARPDRQERQLREEAMMSPRAIEALD